MLSCCKFTKSFCINKTTKIGEIGLGFRLLSNKYALNEYLKEVPNFTINKPLAQILIEYLPFLTQLTQLKKTESMGLRYLFA